MSDFCSSPIDVENTPKLGFGLMRLPHKFLSTDVEQTAEMVDLFLGAGFTYFDTAFVYPGSEAATKKALVERYPRDSYTLATKVNMAIPGISAKAARKQFFTSLERTGAQYFDYYLLHSIMQNNYKKYEKSGLWDYVGYLKSQGLVKHYGFSYHSGPELLDKLLTEHPETEFVQLQLNYADWENPRVSSRANYEVARAQGVPVVVMEPVKGGALANPPKPVSNLLLNYEPYMSCASWAIRFAASLDGILTVLSGMSNVEQMTDNISFMREFKALDDDEMEVIHEAQRLMGKSSVVPCTACRYCDGCPQDIDIPAVFAAMNKQLGTGAVEEAKALYAEAVAGRGSVSDCVGCGRCEAACPQHIEISAELSKAAGMFG